MHHKKVNTEPCLSPESPFMRKPSKEFLKKLALNKNKPKDQDKNMLKSSEYFNEQSIRKISFIPCGTTGSVDSLKNNSIKLKKTTIDLQKFKIRHENLLLKTQQQQMRQRNSELNQENRVLRKQIEELRRQLQSGSRISKLSGETLEHTDADRLTKKKTYTNLQSQESLLQIHSYQILPTGMQISHVNSLVFDDEMKCASECNFMSTSIGKQLQKLCDANNLKNNFNQRVSYEEQIQLLQSRILYLEKELERALVRQKELQDSIKRLILSGSMTQRKLEIKESQLKEIRRKQKQKKYYEKLYELSSEQDHQYQ